jgi:hypothetical protein
MREGAWALSLEHAIARGIVEHSLAMLSQIVWHAGSRGW